MSLKIKHLSSILAPVSLGELIDKSHGSRNQTNIYDWNKAKKCR